MDLGSVILTDKVKLDPHRYENAVTMLQCPVEPIPSLKC